MTANHHDPNTLRNEQYKDSSNFMARVRLSARFSTNPYRWTHWLFDQIDVPDDARILELGAGPGILWYANRGRIPSGWQITLSDFSPGMVAEQRQRLRDVPGHFRFEVIDAQAIPHDDAAFDAVIANHMLYHVPDIPRALAEVRRVLKPTGTFYASTNAASDMAELYELVRAYSGAAIREDQRVIPRFSLDNGESLLRPVFDSVELRRYENSLVVTDAQALVDYVLSGIAHHSRALRQASGGFSAFVDEEIKKTGSFYIRKDTGLFVAAAH